MAAITADLSLDTKQFGDGLKRAQTGLKQFKTTATRTGATASRGMFSGFGRAANNFGEMLAGLASGRSPLNLLHRHFDEFGGALNGVLALTGGLQKAAQLGIGSVQKAMQAETMSISMEVLVGDKTKAEATIATLRKMAAATPFEFPDLATAATKLLGFGVVLDDVIPSVQMLSDIAQGDAEKLERLSLAFGQIASTGRLMGQDLLQLINAQFNPLQIISEKTGESMIALKKRMEAGAVSFEEVRAAFVAVTSAGGRFYRMNERQAQTASGSMSTLRDEFGEVQRLFGTPIALAIKPMIQEAIALMRSLQDEAKLFGDAVGAAMSGAADFLKATFSKVDFSQGLLQGLLQGLSQLAQDLAPVISAELDVAFISAANGLINALRDVAIVFGDDIAAVLRVVATSLAGALDSILSGLQTMLNDMAQNPMFAGMATPAAEAIDRARSGLATATLQFDPETAIQKFAEGSRKAIDDTAAIALRDFMRDSLIVPPFMGGELSPEKLLKPKTVPKAPPAFTRPAAAAAATAGQVGRPVGRLASAINVIMGRSAGEVLYEEAKKQTAEQQKMNATLTQIKNNTQPRPQTPATSGATFGRP